MTRNEYSYKANQNATPIILIIIGIIIIGALGYVLISRYEPKQSDTVSTYDDIMHDQKSIGARHTIGDEFHDGLSKPDLTITYPLDEFGEGIARVDIYNIDINADKLKDKITKSRHENGTDHFHYEYKIELRTENGFLDITPEDFRTVEGAECALQKIHFVMSPKFEVIKISRNWQDTWTTPTIATEIVYKLNKNTLTPGKTKQLREICDVSELF